MRSRSRWFDWLEDKQSELRIALQDDRVVIAREILVSVYDAEYALQPRIAGLDRSDRGARLRRLTDEINIMVEAEVSRFPDEVDHVLGSRSLRSHESLTGRLTYLAWKGRDALSGGAGYFRKLIGEPD